MSLQTAAQAVAKPPITPVAGGILQRACACGQHTGNGGECEECKKKREGFLQRAAVDNASTVEIPDIVHHVLNSPGQPLDTATRAFMEPRFGHDLCTIPTFSQPSPQTQLTLGTPKDQFEQKANILADEVIHMPASITNDRYDFSNVRIHTGKQAIESAQALKARAYTVGQDVVFGAEQFAPETTEGRWLLAHELTHVVQQNSAEVRTNLIQRADLTSPRLAGNPLFERVLDNRAVIEYGDTGPEVRRVQQLLIDLGFSLSGHGADGRFFSETETAVRAFQLARLGPASVDGRVGFRTIAALDSAFSAFTLPINRTDPWSMSCVLGILCPWNRHLVENVLPTFSIITFDSRTFPTETWDGSTWVPDTFTSGGFRGGSNMGFLNTTTCEQMAFTIYHEGWHGQQPSSLTGVVETEKDAYINAEQWSISMGIPGQTFDDTTTGATEDLRTTRAGETVVDEPAAERLVRQEYGGVSVIPGERLLYRVGASDVRVRRPDSSEYTRPAAVGESVRGSVTMTNPHVIDPSSWICP